tara:strand:- start:508 stop:1317 length:810 start_codon:yes stop_codon:yes gene_type:complete
MKGNVVTNYANEILAYLDTRPIDNPLKLYSEESNKLSQLQREFEKTGEYKNSSYSEVDIIDVELYNLRLLMSFITSVHRFEILVMLENFIKSETSGPKKLLSIGVGSGYEIKLCNDYMEDWKFYAYDKGSENINYASDLLRFFNYSNKSLRYKSFPLERKTGISKHKNVYGKIILCELLEHLENPVQALQSARYSLHPEGIMFLTMAINIAQEDHIYLYSSIEQAKNQVKENGLTIIKELIVPQTLFTFKESERVKDLKRGAYVCIVKK